MVGTPKIAQKVDEEAVKTVIEVMKDHRACLLGKSADLLHHFLVLLACKNVSLTDVEAIL